MGKHEIIARTDIGMKRKLPSGVHIIVDRGHAAALGAALGDAVRVTELRPGAEVPAEIVRAASILVVEVHSSEPGSLERVAAIRAARPSLPVVVALEGADVGLTRSLVRHGITDVVALPFDAAELTAQLTEIAARNAPTSTTQLAPMIAVVRAAGGVGATTVITQLAEALVDCAGLEDVCVIDLDLQFGQVANYLGLEPTTTVLELLDASDRLDSDLVRDAAIAAPQGISVVAAPKLIAPLEEVDVDRLLNLLNVARQSFDFVIVDLPSNWTNWTLSAALACNEIMVVTDQSITGLRQTKRVVELFDMMQVDRAGVRVVVNRVEKKLFQPISVNEVANVLNREVSATIARDRGDLQMAQDQGMLLSEKNRKAPFVKDVRRLADQICDRIGGFEQ